MHIWLPNFHTHFLRWAGLSMIMNLFKKKKKLTKMCKAFKFRQSVSHSNLCIPILLMSLVLKGCELNKLWLSSTEIYLLFNLFYVHTFEKQQVLHIYREINFYTFYIHFVRWVVWGVLLNNKTLSCFHQQIQYWLKPVIYIYIYIYNF